MQTTLFTMKIAYLASSFVPSRLANSVHVVKMSQALAENGHEVTLYHKKNPQIDDEPYAFYGVNKNFKHCSIRCGRRPLLNSFLFVSRLVARLKKDSKSSGGFDLIYARNVYSIYLLSSGRTPFIYEAHWKPHGFVKRLETKILKSPALAKLVVISEQLKKIYLETYPFLSEDKIFVAHDGADLPQSKPQLPQNSRLKVAYVGSLDPCRGIELVKTLAEMVPEMDFHIFGGRPPGLLDELKKSQRPDNLIVEGFVPHASLQERLRGFDICLAPYRGDTPSMAWASPMKLFEYMALAKPIICSDFPVIKEILSHDFDAYLADYDQPELWVRYLKELKSDLKRREMGDRAFKKLKAHFTWSARAGQILNSIGPKNFPEKQRQQLDTMGR